MTTYELGGRAVRPAPRRSYSWLREVGLLALLYVGYSLARLVGDATLPTAVAHARDLLAVEQLLHLDVEDSFNSALQAVPALAVAASYWYSVLHYVVTPLVLVWAYRSHPPHYRRARDTLVIASAVGLVGFTLVPMAPPRMLPGFVDTLASTAHAGWWGGDASAPRGLGELTNQLAAMPSLHIAWATWVALQVLACTRVRWARVAAVAHVVLTTVVVVVTANHFVLDVVAGACLAVLMVRAAGWRERRAVGFEHVPAPRGGGRPADREPAGVGLARQRPRGELGPQR